MKSELRKVQILDCENEYNKEYGYFHKWLTYGNNEDGFKNYALIELENGKLVNVNVYGIQFI